MARCKKGDFAIVIREFAGCEGNVGRIVRVVGNASKHFSKSNLWGTLWKFKPISTSGWWECTYRSDSDISEASYSQTISPNSCHPDDWLFPIKAEPTDTTATETTHTPKLEKV